MIKQPTFKPVGPANWGDKPVVIVGAGPSLKGFDLRQLDRSDVRVVAVKEMAFHLPFAELCIGMDHAWVHRRHLALRELKMPVVFAFPREDNPPYLVDDAFTYHQRQDNKFELSRDPNMINIGGSSGSAALGYTLLRGAREVLLMGMDYCSMPDANLREGNHYADEDYPWFTSYNKHMWPHWASWYDAIYDQIPKDVKVFNTSRISAIQKIPRIDFAGFLSLFVKEAA